MSDSDNATNVLGISIPNFKEKYIERKTVTFYEVNITDRITKTDWSLEKRYSDFKTLHDTLSTIIPNLPSIPGVTLFKVTSLEALTKRRLELERFLRICVQRKDILATSPLQDFLLLETKAPEIIGNSETKNFAYEKIPLGVRDFIVVPHKEIMLMCCSDMNIISRADSMLTNFTFPWEKKSNSHIPLGAAFCYQVKKNEGANDYIVHKIWAKSFPMQTGVISWEDTTEVFSVGLDDGKIYAFRAKEGTHYLEFDMLLELQLHKDRVMGLGFDNDSNYMYSCSTDRTFYVTDLNSSPPNPTLIKTSRSGFTNLNFDKKNNRVFLTNESGELSVFLTASFPPVEALNLQITSYSSIRALDISEKNHYIFTGSVNGKINILNLSDPGKEKFISEMTSFGASMKIRICRYNYKSHELITGDEDGRVTVWSLKTGQPVHVWEAHPKSPITQMVFDVDNLLLWTGAKDKAFRVWSLPEKWDSKAVEHFETNEVKNINENLAILKMQHTLRKEEDEGSDSSDDDLNGWDFR